MKSLFQEIYTFFEHAVLKNMTVCSVWYFSIPVFYYIILSTKYHMIDLEVGLCDMDKKYISRFFDFFFDFDFNHDFDTNRHALSYTSCFCTSCFCTSYLSCTSCFALFFILLHILLYFFFLHIYIYIYIYMLLCGVTFI